MKYELILNERSKVNFVGLKTLIKQFNIDKNDNSLNRELRTLNIEPIKVTSFSVTSSTDFFNQIRFYTHNRVERIFSLIVKRLLVNNHSVKIYIWNSNFLDEGSLWFVNFVKNKFKNIEIIEKNNSTMKSNVVYEKEEMDINYLLKGALLDEKEFDFLMERGNHYLNIGDYLTALNIYNYLENFDSRPFLYNQIATAYTMKGDTVQAEYYLLKWYNYGSKLDKAYACYSLSMLYARHMKKETFLVSKAMKYIEEGYSHLEEIESIDKEKLIRDRLFNRNGYALFLFRSGNLSEAIEIEKNAIDVLDGLDIQNQGVLLQKTVLLFNLGQCYAKATEFEKAIKVYTELLELDPYFPEYYLEISKCYIEIKDFKSANEVLNKAYELNDVIPELHSLKGFVYYSLGNMDEAKNSYCKAYQLNNDNEKHLYDYLYLLTELDKYSEAIEELNRVNNIEDIYIKDSRYISLLAEIYFNNDKHNNAIDILEIGEKIFKDNSEVYRSNKEIIERMMVDG